MFVDVVSNSVALAAAAIAGRFTIVTHLLRTTAGAGVQRAG